jgi:WD40 repeat protein
LKRREGEHLLRITEGNSKKPAAAVTGKEGAAGGGPAPVEKKSAPDDKASAVKVMVRAKILLSISYETLWENFLLSTSNSFAISTAEAASLLAQSLKPDVLLAPADAGASGGDGKALTQADIDAYIELVKECYHKNAVVTPPQAKDAAAAAVAAAEGPGPVPIDFMAVCSSVLLLNDAPLEMKLDRLFEWITMGEKEYIEFNDMWVAVTSFERGLSNAMGEKECTEAFCKDVADKYMKLADPRKSGKIYQKDFFDFCMNRRYSVRRFLESLGNASVKVPKAENADTDVNVDNTMRAPSGGDEFMANPAWKKTAEKMVPKGAISVPIKPASSLKLDWVHGYRGYDCRNNVAYTDKGGNLISFHAAALSIMQSCTDAKRTQSYFGEHTDDIISIAQYPNADWSEVLVATGEIGKQPPIHLYVWKATMGRFEALSCMRGFHVKGVSQLCFSGDGKRLFSVGVDYTVAVYGTDRGAQSTFGKMIFSAQGPKGKAMHCCAAGPTGEDFVSSGEKHVQFWRSNKGTSYTQETGKISGHTNKMHLSAVRAQGAQVIIGTSEGDVLRFAVTAKALEVQPTGHGLHGSNKVNVNALMATPVPAGAASKDSDTCFVVSGGKDGKVMVWAVLPDKLQKCAEFTVTGFNGPLPALRAVAVSSDGSKCVVGTVNCELIEFTRKDGKPFLAVEAAAVVIPEADLVARPLLSAHYKDELWGLAVMPSLDGKMSDEYCTVGDDGILRLWSIAQRRQVCYVDMKGVARCCTYSPDGSMIAVGFGGSVTQGKLKEEGMLRIYRVERDPSAATPDARFKFTVMSDIKEAKRAISVVRFSPDGSTIAAGARDNSIYLYSVAQQFKRKAKFSKHNAGINQLDFTADGKALQSCCSAYEILFSDTSSGVQIGNAVATLLDAEWATWTCSLGWSVQGIWNGTMDGSDVNSVDRSPSGKLLAVADDFGQVSVYRYPCIMPGAEASVYTGHSSHVTSVCWVEDNLVGGKRGEKYLISTGGEDKCVFQWLNVTASDADLRAALAAAAGAATTEAPAGHAEEDDHMEGPGGGDEFTAVKPWLGAIVAPTAWSATPPADTKDNATEYRRLLTEFSAMHGDLRKKQDDAAKLATYDAVRKKARDVFNKMSDSGVTSAAAPDNDELELEWVHGIRAFDTRNNVRYMQGPKNSKGEPTFKLVYHVASLGVVYDPLQRKQRYFRGHTDDIMSLATYTSAPEPGKDPVTWVATGQQAAANTYVWDASSLQTLAVLQTGQKSINMYARASSLCFVFPNVSELGPPFFFCFPNRSGWRSPRTAACSSRLPRTSPSPCRTGSPNASSPTPRASPRSPTTSRRACPPRRAPRFCRSATSTCACGRWTAAT